VRDVDQHPETVHLVDHLLAEIGQALRLALGTRFISGGRRPGVVVGVRQGHVSDTEGVVVAQQAHVVLNRVAAFDAHQCGDLAMFTRCKNFSHGAGEGDVVRVTLDDVVAHGVDHLQRAVRRVVALYVVRAHVNGEEDASLPAFLHARNVGVPVLGAWAEIETIYGSAGDVVVGVDQQRRAMNLHHLGVGPGLFLSEDGLQEHGNRDGKGTKRA
jgi:hypothetical protein